MKVIDKFYEHDPFYFWHEKPFTQWTVSDNQFKFSEDVAHYAGSGVPGTQEVEYSFSSTEQWMMWRKARLFGDNELARVMLETSDPKTVKDLGRKVANFNQEAWDKYKLDIVIAGNYLKFDQNPEWKERLTQVVRNRQYFVEASPYDRVWGIGIRASEARAGHNWKGENLLGIALTNVAMMFIREQQQVMYQEDVQSVSVSVVDALAEALEKQGINTKLLPNLISIEDDFSDYVEAWIEERYGRGEYRHHH